MTSLFLPFFCLNSLMDLYCLPNNMWIPPPQFSNEDPTLSKGFTSSLLFVDPALLPSGAVCYPSVLPFASRQTQPLSSSSKATPLDSFPDPAGPAGFLLPPGHPSLAVSQGSAFISLYLTLPPLPALQGQTTSICRPWETK